MTPITDVLVILAAAAALASNAYTLHRLRTKRRRRIPTGAGIVRALPEQPSALAPEGDPA